MTTVRTTIVTLRTDAQQLRSTLEGYVAERRLRGEEIARFRGVMREIQGWCNLGCVIPSDATRNFIYIFQVHAT